MRMRNKRVDLKEKFITKTIPNEIVTRELQRENGYESVVRRVRMLVIVAKKYRGEGTKNQNANKKQKDMRQTTKSKCQALKPFSKNKLMILTLRAHMYHDWLFELLRSHCT